MNLWLNFLFSLTILVIAAEVLVKLVERLSAKVRISPLVIGATIIAVGTSLPETFVAISALAQKVSRIALGSIIGSNIANVALIFGLGISLFPVRLGTQKTQRNNLILLLLTLAFVALSFLPAPVRKSLAFFLLAFYLIFLVAEIVWGEVGRTQEDKKALARMPRVRGRPLYYLGGIALSLAALVVSGHWLVTSAIKIAEIIKVSPEIIGLTLVAVGTSLPELTTTLIAGVRGDWKLIAGDIQGSNIYNLSVLGTLMLVLGGENGYEPAHYLSLFFLGLTTLAIFILTRRYEGTHIPRIFGLIFLASYAIYLVLIL